MKKAFALFLCLVMMLSLVACGGKPATTTPTTPETSAPEKKEPAPTTPETTPETEPEKTSNVPQLKGPGNVTLKRLGYNTAFDPNKDINAQVMEESTGYHVEYFMLPAENADEKLLMDISGGADYDCVNVTINQFRTLMAQGGLQPLDDLLEAYGQDILNSGHSEEVWNALRGEDGHIYAVPYMYPCDHEIANFMVARLDLCREAGITEMPTTIDGFYDMLVKLKEFYGDKYIILSGPFYQASEANEAWAIPKTITAAFGIYSDWMVNDEGKVIYMTEHPNFPALVEFMSKLYKEGLIDPDWAVNTESTLKEKFSSGKTIICCGNRGLGDYAMPALMENLKLTWDDLGYVTALSGSDGTCKYMETTAFNFVSCVPKSSGNAADVVNWWNLRLKDDLHITIGDEGVHFKYDANGGIDPINPIFAEERGNSYWYMDVSSATWGSQLWPARVRKSASQWHAFSAVTMNADTNRIEFVTNEFKFKPATEAYSKYNTTLFNSLKDYLLQVMAGIRTIDDLGTFTKDWVNAGGEEVRTELQSYYDSKK